MPSHPHNSPLALAPSPRPRRVGLSIWKEARIREILRTTTTPSEPWIDAQIKSALNITPNGCAYVYRYLDPTVFPPGGHHTKMVRCPTCNIFNPPNAFEDGQCLDHPDFDAWGPSPSAIAIQKLQIFHGEELYSDLPPDDWLSLQREIERHKRRQQKKRNPVSED